MKVRQLQAHVNQCDETTVEVIHDDRPAGSKSYMWVHLTDGLAQYHKIARELEHLENANCWAHARRDFSDAIKAIGKGNQKAIKESVAYKALVRISAIYKLEGTLRDLTPEERLKERQASIKPLVEEYFAWVKETIENKTLLPKGKAADGLHYRNCQSQQTECVLLQQASRLSDAYFYHQWEYPKVCVNLQTDVR